jgi:LysR family transcriptional activator of dmlA
MPAYALPPADLYVYYPSRRNLPAKARAFIDFLVSEFKR